MVRYSNYTYNKEMNPMKRIYDALFLAGVKAHILLDRVLTAIEEKFGKKHDNT